MVFQNINKDQLILADGKLFSAKTRQALNKVEGKQQFYQPRLAIVNKILF